MLSTVKRQRSNFKDLPAWFLLFLLDHNAPDHTHRFLYVETLLTWDLAVKTSDLSSNSSSVT